MSLRVFSKKDVKCVPYKLPTDARINLSISLKQNFTKTLLVYEGIKFQIWIKDTEIIFKKGNRLFSVSEAAYLCGPIIWCFKDKDSGKAKQIKYMVVALNPKSIHPSIMDVALFHELREMYYQVIHKIPEKISHRKARKDERKYVKKFLSPAEMQIYNKFFMNYRPVIRELGAEEIIKIAEEVKLIQQKEEKDEPA